MPMIYHFDGFELDTGRFELRDSGQAVPLEPQVFALICFLVENSGHMVSKEELIENFCGSQTDDRDRFIMGMGEWLSEYTS